MEWLAKLEKKNKGKPTKTIAPIEQTYSNGDDALVIEDSDDEDVDEDGNLLPDPSAGSAKALSKVETEKAINPAMQKVMDGEIPVMIFNSTREQSFFSADVAGQFFEMFTSFRAITVQPRISQHVLEVLDEHYPSSAATCSCRIREPIIGVSPQTADFARALREVLSRLNKGLETTDDVPALKQKTVSWIDECLATPGLDEGIKTVLEHTKGKLAG